MAKPKPVSTGELKEERIKEVVPEKEKAEVQALTIEQPPEEQEDEIQDKSKKKPHSEKDEKKKKKRCNILNSGWFPLLSFFLFSIIYFIVYINLESSMMSMANDLKNQDVFDIFVNYSIFLGFAIGFISMIGAYVFYGIKKIIRLGKITWINPIILIILYAPWLNFAYELLYKEKRWTDIGIGFISFVGPPLWQSVWIMIWICLGWFVLALLFSLLRKWKGSKGITVILLVLGSSLLLSGCLAQLEEIACIINPDSDHCYQGTAVQSGDTTNCEKIKGEKFKDSGSNPPQDKCYMMVAANTFNYDICKKCKGGLISYSREDCILEVALQNQDIVGCKKLSGDMKKQCREALGEKLNADEAIAVDTQIDTIKQELQKGDDKNLKDQLKGLEEKQKEIVDNLPPDEKKKYDETRDPGRSLIYGDYAVGDIDEATKNGLLAMNDKLKAQGIKMTIEQYNALRDYMKYVNDPKNDIEQMTNREITTMGVGDRVGGWIDKLKIWKNDTAQDKAVDQQLRYYEKMLERQVQINQGLSAFDIKLQTAFSGVTKVGAFVGETAVKSMIFSTLAGDVGGKLLGASVFSLKLAVGEFKDAAKSAEFRGLVNAYNLGMREEMGKGMSADKAHEIVQKNMESNPTFYTNTHTLAQFGNLLENKDCDGSNPHCLNKTVFWKSMKKSYKYQNNVP